MTWKPINSSDLRWHQARHLLECAAVQAPGARLSGKYLAPFARVCRVEAAEEWTGGRRRTLVYRGDVYQRRERAHGEWTLLGRFTADVAQHEVK